MCVVFNIFHCVLKLLCIFWDWGSQTCFIFSCHSVEKQMGKDKVGRMMRDLPMDVCGDVSISRQLLFKKNVTMSLKGSTSINRESQG